MIQSSSIDEENEEVKEVTLEILYDQIKLYSSELFIELNDVKKDLFKQIQSEYQSLYDEIDGLKKNLQEKDDILTSLKTGVDKKSAWGHGNPFWTCQCGKRLK